MAKDLLDTCVCISMFRNEGRVRETLREVGIKNCFISEITVAELYFGLAKATDKSRKLEIYARYSGFSVSSLPTRRSRNMEKYATRSNTLDSVSTSSTC